MDIIRDKILPNLQKRKDEMMDEFEVDLKWAKNQEEGKKKKKVEKKVITDKGKEIEALLQFDSDDNIETYYNYCAQTIGLFHLVVFY